MTGPVVVRAESVAKRYQLGIGSDRPTLGQAVQKSVRRPLRRLLGRPDPGPEPTSESEEIWAVRDVSFDLHEGEVLGIVGRNGAGKSTLLKLLSGITLPTEGRITVHGRISTLIEVGTGFHPELNGRENVFLNGAILGMRRTQIYARYDEIVEFAGIERFMETPVKRYSSGMFARLAFAVAAHLDPEILLVDEVLSVGDAEFQRKCLGKIRTVAGEGRGVIFVTHDLNAVKRLCSRVILLEEGGVKAEGDPEDVINEYLVRAPQIVDGISIIPDAAERNGTGEARLRSLAMRERDGNVTDEIRIGQPFQVTGVFEVSEPVERVTFELCIYGVEGGQILSVHSIDGGQPPVDVGAGMQEITVELEPTLLPHEFVIGMALHRMSGMTVDHVERAHSFKVLNVGDEGQPKYPWSHVRGYVRPSATWSDLRHPAEPTALTSGR